MKRKDMLVYITLTIFIVISLVLAMMFAGCNYAFVDTTYHFHRAIVQLPDGTVIDGEVEKWTDYEDGDQLQVKIGGVEYLVHSSDVVLISEP